LLNNASCYHSGPPPDVVTNVVLKAVTSENPSIRYLAGEDVQKLVEAKRGLSDEEFHNMMKESMRK
jgi:hypothetical protein